MTSTVPLGGIDYFHLANDRAQRRRGLCGNHCAVVVELGGVLDAGRLAVRLARAVDALPELSWQLAPTLPGMLPRWRFRGRRSPPPVSIVPASGPAARDAALVELLERRLDGASPWCVDVVRTSSPEPRDTLVLRWFHPLTDARGAERIVRWLGSTDGDGPEAPPPAEARFDSSERPLAKLDRDARIALARAYGAHATALARTPTLSPAGSARGRLGKTRAARVTLTEAETRAFDLRVRKEARLAESSVMVLASARLVDRVLTGRGLAPAQLLVPVPLSLDPKVGSQRMFGNHLAMMMFSLDRDDLRDDARAIQRLAEQQRAIVREKLDLGMAAALELARRLPTPVLRLVATRPFGGEMGSLIFSNPGLLTLTSFAGLPVVDAYPMPSAITPPGFQVIFSRFAGRLSAQVIHVEGALTSAEAAPLASVLRADLTR